MANRSQMTGMRGVYLAAAELSRLGFIVSPTSRSAMGADLLVTNQTCTNAFSVQVKTNATASRFWLVGKKARELVAPTHIYVLVNLNDKGDSEKAIEYFVVPSAELAGLTRERHRPRSVWYSVTRNAVEEYKDRWELFGAPD